MQIDIYKPRRVIALPGIQPDTSPRFSGVDGDPIDAQMSSEGIRRWIAIAVQLAEKGAKLSDLANENGLPIGYAKSVLKGDVTHSSFMQVVAAKLDLPVSTVFPNAAQSYQWRAVK